MVLTSSTLCMDSNEWPQIHHHHKQQQPSSLMVSLPLLLPSSTTITTTTTPTTSSSSSSTKAATMDQLVAGHVKPQPDPTLKCPRCDSTNTKFCYYNNYSLSQPRHFCKACKRYWTKGGTLRNVPVGGGCRKNKRQVKRSSTNSSIISSTHHLVDNPINNATTITSSSTMQNPNQLFMNNQDFMHLNNSLMTSLKSAISGLGFPHDKDQECNFMQDHQHQAAGGFTHMTHETGSNSIFPTSLPNMGQHVGGDHHHGLNGSVIMASEPHWIRQIHQHNLFVPLDELGPKSAGNDDHHNGNSMRNMDMKIEDDHGVVGRNYNMCQNIHEWQIPNLNVFEENNITSDQAAGLFWNTSNIGPWTDVNNYGSSSVASML